MRFGCGRGIEVECVLTERERESSCSSAQLALAKGLWD